MNHRQDEFVRFQDWKSERSSEGNFHAKGGVHRSKVVIASNELHNGLESGKWRAKGIIQAVKSSLSGFVEESLGSKKNILDPQGPFLQKWNKIFVLSCVIAISLDPLFLYIPVIDNDNKCLGLNRTLEVTASVLRSFTDIFYFLHIALQFRTGFIAPSSRVFGRGVLIEDAWEIVKRYLSTYFLIDILAVLPLPQVVILIIIPKLRGSRSLNTKNLLKSVVFFQYIPRVLRVYPLYREVTRTSGILTETAWAGAAFNLFLYMLASHVFLAYKLMPGIPRICKSVVFFQYIPRVLRVYPLYREVTRTSGILTETAWAGAAFNLFLYMLASHVLGAFWYLFSIERETTCWKQACGNSSPCHHASLYCDDDHTKFKTLLNSSCPIETPNATLFDFGIFLGALQSGVVGPMDFPQKFFYCFWWGLQNLSSLGQNLQTSTFIWEICFAVFISIAGLVLFAFLIGNMQTCLQSSTLRLEEMRVKRRDAEQWMSHRLLPENLRERIRRYEQYRWQETRGVDEENLIHNLPKDLRRDIKRHLCLALLMRVPMFEKMDEQLLDALCDHLKPVLFTKDSFIVREGDPVDAMLFVMRGKLLSVTTNGGRTGFFNSEHLKAGDFCGEELLTWALDPNSSTNLPISTRTAQALSEVEAFALVADDLKLVASQFRRLHSKQLRHTFRFYSGQWRTWAACFIQAAWRSYCRKKVEESLRDEENRLQDALTNEGGSSPSLGATFYASRFAANALHALRRNTAKKARVPDRISPILLQKPTEPDFTAEDN